MNIRHLLSTSGKLLGLKLALDKRSEEAYDFFQQYLMSRSARECDACYAWASNKRNIHGPGMACMAGEQACTLEGVAFDQEKKERMFFAGAVARISDDLIDNGLARAEEVSLFSNGTHPDDSAIPEMRLFRIFHQGLEERLPSNFTETHRQVIDCYNAAQRDSMLLRGNISREEVVSIKDRTGGYAWLLFLSILSPDQHDPAAGLTPRYRPRHHLLPLTKAGSHFNLGALFSRIDDLYDARQDRGSHQLASLGETSWETIGEEARYVAEGLRQFYDEEHIAPLVAYCELQISQVAGVMNNALDSFSKMFRRRAP